MKASSFQHILAGFDFTLNKYEELCRSISQSNYICITLADYLALGRDTENQRFIIMRHDIDRTPQRALGVALVEREYGIQATYYFRDRRQTYKPEILDKIAALGHEIGYHYETIDKCRGNAGAAKLLFTKELANFRNRYTVKTICAHGNPLTRYDNKDIWKNARFSDFGLLGEAFLSLDFSKFAYFSDSGRTWLNNESQKMPGKDAVKTAFDEAKPENTDDVIRIIQEEQLPNICILTHPERWSGDIPGFARRYLLDLVFSWGKVAIYAYRRITDEARSSLV